MLATPDPAIKLPYRSSVRAADLLLVGSNPLEDISVLSQPEGQGLRLIIKGGRLVKNALQAAATAS